jgi:uncharacterized membrane protein YfcA
VPETRVDYEIVLLLMLAAACAGFVDSIAGGGGLITLPALLLSGLTPVEAVATNKLQGTFGVAAATAGFARAGHIDFKSLAPLVATTGAGAALGALLVGRLDQQALAAAMPFALIAVAIYFALAPRLRRKATSAPLSMKAFALAVAAPIGFYDGFFGPGTGSLFALGFVSLMGLGLLQATANTKVLNLTSNLVSLAIFVVTGHIVYAIGLPMALGQAAGAWVGAHTAMTHGERVIRPLLIFISVAVALRLLFDGGNPVGHWLFSLSP